MFDSATGTPPSGGLIDRRRRGADRPVRRWLLVLAAFAAPLAGVDFTVPTGAGDLTYRYVPATGTLDDLVVLAGGRELRPAAGGGIATFRLGGDLLEAGDRRHQSAVVGESWSGQTYTATFTWTHEFESFDFTVAVRREGSGLVLDFASAADRVHRFDVGRAEGVPDARIVDLPYGHNVLLTRGLFASALLDPERSNASEIYPRKRYPSADSAEYGDQASYRERTDGSRGTLRERILITVSPEIEETFYHPPNPVSRHRKRLSRYVVADLWRGASFDEHLGDLQFLVDQGIENVFAIVHVWQRYGYDNGLPSTVPAAAAMGGDAGLRAVSDLCRANGYLLGLHTNYVDFYPNSDVWQPADLALDSEGRPIETWLNPETGIQSFLMKPSRALRYARLHEPEIRRRYRTRAAFLDVHSAVLPSGLVDHDAAVPGAGRQQATLAAYRELFSYVRKAHRGPVAGEGKGFATPLWAGYIDAIEADPRSLHQQIEGRGGTAVPTLVDYKLRVLHRLFVPHGVGYLGRFYPRKARFRRADFDRYLATEIAFGNAAFLDTRYFRPAYRPELLRKVRFLQLLQRRYLSARADRILYRVGDRDLALGEALLQVLPGIGRGRVDSALSEKLGVLRVDYDPDLTLWVNRAKKRSVEIVHQGVTYRLRRNDFLAVSGARVLAFSAIVGGTDSEYVCDTCAP